MADSSDTNHPSLTLEITANHYRNSVVNFKTRRVYRFDISDSESGDIMATEPDRNYEIAAAYGHAPNNELKTLEMGARPREARAFGLLYNF